MRCTDAMFTIGSTHTVCEDYAIAWPDGGVVSDGCSGSSHTDVGARLLCWDAKRQLASSVLLDLPSEPLAACKQLGIPIISLLATTMSVTDDDSKFIVQVSGDGVVAARRRDGSVYIIQIDYASNAPFYAAYKLMGDMIHIDSCDTERRLTIFDTQVGDDPVHHEVQPQAKEDPYLVLTFEKDDYDLVAVFSDGVESFRRRVEDRTEQMHFRDVVVKCLQVQRPHGQFMQRRIHRFLREVTSEGWFHYDDLSVAALFDDGE